MMSPRSANAICRNVRRPRRPPASGSREGAAVEIDDVIALLEQEWPGSYSGHTVSPGHTNYEYAKRNHLLFVRCEESYADPAYPFREYVAPSPSGRFYVAVSLAEGPQHNAIECGWNGYHDPPPPETGLEKA